MKWSTHVGEEALLVEYIGIKYNDICMLVNEFSFTLEFLSEN